MTPEAIFNKWSTITDFSKSTHPTSGDDMMSKVMTILSAPAPEAPKASPSTPALKADEIFGMMATYLARGEGKALIPKVSAVFGFEITKTKGGKVETIYEINLKEGQGFCKKGKPAKADATFTMTDDDFE